MVNGCRQRMLNIISLFYYSSCLLVFLSHFCFMSTLISEFLHRCLDVKMNG